MLFKKHSIASQGRNSTSLAKKKKFPTIFRGNSSKSSDASIESELTWTLSEDGTTRHQQGPQNTSNAIDRKRKLTPQEQSNDDAPSFDKCQDSIKVGKKRRLTAIFRLNKPAINSSRTWTLDEDKENQMPQKALLQSNSILSKDDSFTRISHSIESKELQHKKELDEREDVIRQVMGINEDIKSQHHEAVQQLCQDYDKRLKEKDEMIQTLETRHRKQIDNRDIILDSQEEALLQAQQIIENQQKQLEEKDLAIQELKAKHAEELEVYDKVLLEQEENLHKADQDLENAIEHLEISNAMLVEARRMSKV